MNLVVEPQVGSIVTDLVRRWERSDEGWRLIATYGRAEAAPDDSKTWDDLLSIAQHLRFAPEMDLSAPRNAGVRRHGLTWYGHDIVRDLQSGAWTVIHETYRLSEAVSIEQAAEAAAAGGLWFEGKLGGREFDRLVEVARHRRAREQEAVDRADGYIRA